MNEAKSGWSITPHEVFDHLDLDRPGLERVKSAVEKGNHALASSELLAYYRARTSVKFPLNTGKNAAGKSTRATARDLKVARNALNHILISQPSYPPHDYGKDIDWLAMVHPDVEWIAQLHRMYWWEPMGKAYLQSGDEAFAREWTFQILDWKQKCPPGDYPAGSAEWYVWEMLNIGIRGYDVCRWYHYFRDADAFTPDFLLELLVLVYEHARLLEPRYSAGSNWGLMESEGLSYIAMTFPEFKQAAAWRERGFQRLSAELDAQVLADGMQRETCFSYHGGCILWFLRTADLADLNGIEMPENYRARVERMYHILAYCVKPDGTSPMFGDSWNGSALGAVRTGADSYRRPDLAYIGSLDSKKRRGTEPRETCLAFQHSGYYIFRSDWTPDAVWMALKCGPDGGWHAQPDNCSFELFAYGSYLMPDSGCFIYSGDEKSREFFRATARHQCLTLDGENSSSAPRLLLWTNTPDITALTVENQSYPTLAHRRSVFFLQRRFFIIVDEVIGDAPGKCRLHFQYGPPQATMADDGAITVKGRRGTGELFFKPFIAGFHAEKEKGWAAFQYRRKKSRSAFGYDLGTARVFGSLLLPHSNSSPRMTCEAGIMPGSNGGAFQAGQPVLELDITIDGVPYRLRRDLETREVRLQPRRT